MKTPIRAGAFLVVAIMGIALLAGSPARAQGCVAARMDSSALTGGGCAPEGEWQVTASWRYFKSDRHFVGPDEQKDRETEQSQVINWFHQASLNVAYQFNSRWSGAINVPYAMYRRSRPIRDADREVIDRSESRATGLGDVDVRAKRWMFDPATHHQGNFRLGFGIKLPTGDYSVHDTRKNYDPETMEYSHEVRTVDQSIQPGDGGFGFILDLEGFRSVGHSATFYAQLNYLFNPQGDNGVPTYRRRETEAIMSVADQWLARFGFSFPVGQSGTSLSLGARGEGVPVYDVFGNSDDFRRPGYAISVDPSLTYTRGMHSFGISVPFAVYRDRERSVPDKKEPGRHGDAAFADYNIIGSYAYRF